jgi:DNA-binding GntR family transcriptional regulator
MHENHHAAINAIKTRDPEAMRAAIAADITEGMGLIGRTGFTNENGPSV